ncbi:hypothetical protein U0035_19770 [Niabella yanshanensis]|uniref:Outer membrane protein beta-barrel domain-containing protein n=1 Tax=Niabella yanshanensis TaxID=577386 RepID=A0ABZ0W3R0_9BACT|nr:hypothetical protein [Niabella yanshanensis]WQD37908.1 hypothetical protein U0035_19770 [Niabella yanshanensis]
MRRIILGCGMLVSILSAHAQKAERSPFRRGYLRLGINSLPGKINTAMSPKENILASQYGAGTGLAFEMGKVYYFNKPESGDLIGYGLDWTVISLTYNPLSKWKEYERQAGEPGATSKPLAASLSTKLGPAISFNPIEKLVIDARLQLMAYAHGYNYSYETGNNSFQLENGIEEDSEEKILDNVLFGFKPNMGITARRGIIGLSLDYAPGNTNMNYSEYTEVDQESTTIYGKSKIKTNNLQLKLSVFF